MRKTLILLSIFLSLPAFAEQADVLEYRVRESAGAPYVSRFLVTPRWLRIDQGEEGDGYLLFDRQRGIVHDVSDEDRTVLEIDPPRAGQRVSHGLRFQLVPIDDADAPRIAGVVPRHLLLKVDGADCQEIVVVPGLMQRAVDAWREFATRLADQQATTLAAMPAGSQSECDLLTHVYAPARALELGLPVFWHQPGKDRALQDYARDRRVDAELFTLPKGYRRLRLPTNRQ